MRSTELTVREAARLTGYCLQHLYNLITTGRLRARRPDGYQYFINRAALLAWARANRRKIKQ